jgi:hypothetical protein
MKKDAERGSEKDFADKLVCTSDANNHDCYGSECLFSAVQSKGSSLFFKFKSDKSTRDILLLYLI